MPHFSLVVGYHGCDREVGQRVLLDQEKLSPKENPWDWLGTGIYFWEGSPSRALAFAEEKKRRGWGDQPIKDPWVLGAYINLGSCFDLTDFVAVQQLPDHHALLVKGLQAAGQPAPVNRGIKSEDDHDLVLRNLDCAVMNLAMRRLDQKAPAERTHYYQTIRGVFVEGKPIYEGARIYEKTHIQIAVRDPSCIIGYFRPTG